MRALSEDMAFAKGLIGGDDPFPLFKFGKAPDFDTADGFVDVWDGADDGGINQMQYTYSTSAAIDTISSDDVTDTEPIEVQGLTADYTLTVQEATLNGQNKVTLTTPLLRVFRMKNIGTTDIAGNVYCYEDGAITLGVPDDKTTIRAMIQGDNNQTLMALYTVPLGYEIHMDVYWASMAVVAFPGDVYANIQLKSRLEGGVFQLKNEIDLLSSGNSTIQRPAGKTTFLLPEKTDIAMRAFCSGDTVAISAGFEARLIKP